jgi:hypothetical protein
MGGGGNGAAWRFDFLIRCEFSTSEAELSSDDTSLWYRLVGILHASQVTYIIIIIITV